MLSEDDHDKKIVEQIQEIVDKCPDAAEIMFNHGMHCVGCAVAASESLEDGCKSHGMSDEDVDKIVKEINKKLDK